MQGLVDIRKIDPFFLLLFGNEERGSKTKLHLSCALRGSTR